VNTKDLVWHPIRFYGEENKTKICFNCLRYEEGVYKPYSLLTRGMIKESPYLSKHIVYSHIDAFINRDKSNSRFSQCGTLYVNDDMGAVSCIDEAIHVDFRKHCFWNQSNPRMGVYMIYKDIIRIGYSEKVKRKGNNNENKNKNKKKRAKNN
jgi:hypothetical protein